MSMIGIDYEYNKMRNIARGSQIWTKGTWEKSGGKSIAELVNGVLTDGVEFNDSVENEIIINLKSIQSLLEIQVFASKNATISSIQLDWSKDLLIKSGTLISGGLAYSLPMSGAYSGIFLPFSGAVAFPLSINFATVMSGSLGALTCYIAQCSNIPSRMFSLGGISVASDMGTICNAQFVRIRGLKGATIREAVLCQSNRLSRFVDIVSENEIDNIAATDTKYGDMGETKIVQIDAEPTTETLTENKGVFCNLEPKTVTGNSIQHIGLTPDRGFPDCLYYGQNTNLANIQTPTIGDSLATVYGTPTFPISHFGHGAYLDSTNYYTHPVANNILKTSGMCGIWLVMPDPISFSQTTHYAIGGSSNSFYVKITTNGTPAITQIDVLVMTAKLVWSVTPVSPITVAAGDRLFIGYSWDNYNSGASYPNRRLVYGLNNNALTIDSPDTNLELSVAYTDTNIWFGRYYNDTNSPLEMILDNIIIGKSPVVPYGIDGASNDAKITAKWEKIKEAGVPMLWEFASGKSDYVYYNSKIWKCLKSNINQTPSEGAYWTELAGTAESNNWNATTMYYRLGAYWDDVDAPINWEEGNPPISFEGREVDDTYFDGDYIGFQAIDDNGNIKNLEQFKVLKSGSSICKIDANGTTYTADVLTLKATAQADPSEETVALVSNEANTHQQTVNIKISVESTSQVIESISSNGDYSVYQCCQSLLSSGLNLSTITSIDMYAAWGSSAATSQLFLCRRTAGSQPSNMSNLTAATIGTSDVKTLTNSKILYNYVFSSPINISNKTYDYWIVSRAISGCSRHIVYGNPSSPYGGRYYHTNTDALSEISGRDLYVKLYGTSPTGKIISIIGDTDAIITQPAITEEETDITNREKLVIADGNIYYYNTSNTKYYWTGSAWSTTPTYLNFPGTAMNYEIEKKWDSTLNSGNGGFKYRATIYFKDSSKIIYQTGWTTGASGECRNSDSIPKADWSVFGNLYKAASNNYHIEINNIKPNSCEIARGLYEAYHYNKAFFGIINAAEFADITNVGTNKYIVRKTSHNRIKTA